MDHATRVSLRLKQYAEALASANARHTDDHALELGSRHAAAAGKDIRHERSFWDEDDSVFGNVRNLEHWLGEARRQSMRPRQSITEQSTMGASVEFGI